MANFKSAILMTGSATTASGQDVELIAPIDVQNEDIISFQFYNPNGTAGHIDTIKVYGRLAATSGTLGAAAEWTQIGDDVVVSGSTYIESHDIARSEILTLTVHDNFIGPTLTFKASSINIELPTNIASSSISK